MEGCWAGVQAPGGWELGEEGGEDGGQGRGSGEGAPGREGACVQTMVLPTVPGVKAEK